MDGHQTNTVQVVSSNKAVVVIVVAIDSTVVGVNTVIGNR